MDSKILQRVLNDTMKQRNQSGAYETSGLDDVARWAVPSWDFGCSEGRVVSTLHLHLKTGLN
jgi:hypothetical protein